MDVLATRVLSYTDDAGRSKEITLTVFMPFEVKEDEWKCEFAFDPPIYRTTIAGAGVDFIHAFLVALKVARIFFESTEFFGRAHWQGMFDCGIPSRAKKPASVSSSDIPLLEGNSA